MNLPILGILLGDAAGIGPEIVARYLGSGKWKGKFIPYLIGDQTVFNDGMKYAQVAMEYSIIQSKKSRVVDNKIYLFDNRAFRQDEVKKGVVSREAGLAMISMLREAVDCVNKRIVDGFVYAPLNKNAMYLADDRFSDESQVIQHFADVHSEVTEMNYGAGLWTSRVTGHICFKNIPYELSKERILKTIEMTHILLKKFGKSHPKVFVAALNPHASDGGIFGEEERMLIAPAIESARAKDIDASGPFPADSIFFRGFAGECDAVVTMYHDQGQIALKTKCFEEAVTLLAGLPFVAVTPAHGGAYDMVGQGKATDSSFAMAAQIATKLIGNS